MSQCGPDADLAQLEGLKNLETLILLGTLATDAGVAQLKKALPGCTIDTRVDPF